MIVMCRTCGNKVKTYPSRVRVYKNIFCSKKCAGIFTGFKDGYKPWNKDKQNVTVNIQHGRRVVRL